MDKLRLKLNPDGTTRSYDIYPIESVDEEVKKESTSISLPGQSYKDNILMGMSGQTGTLRISFVIVDDGTDRANGTAPTGEFTDDTVVTVQEQIRYLKDFMQDPSFTAKWELDDLTGDMYNNLEVFYGKISVPTYQRDSPRWRSARMELTVGKGV